MNDFAFLYYGTCDCCLRDERRLQLTPAHGMAAYLCAECLNIQITFRQDPILLARKLREVAGNDVRPAHGRRRAPGMPRHI